MCTYVLLVRQLVTRLCVMLLLGCVREYLCATSAGISAAVTAASKVAFQFQLSAKAPAYPSLLPSSLSCFLNTAG